MKPSWVQRGADPAKDIRETWGVYVRSIPFRPFPDVKDAFVRSWPEASGDEEYLPSSPVFKAYDMDVELVYVGGLNTAYEGIRQLCAYLAGGEFSIFDSFTKMGCRARYVSYNDKVFYRREDDTVQFSVKLKVCKPLSYGISLEPGVATSFKATSATTVYWSDGTTTTYAAGATVSKTSSKEGFAVVAPAAIT